VEKKNRIPGLAKGARKRPGIVLPCGSARSAYPSTGQIERLGTALFKKGPVETSYRRDIPVGKKWYLAVKIRYTDCKAIKNFLLCRKHYFT
jgi:hypothetical protein